MSRGHDSALSRWYTAATAPAQQLGAAPHELAGAARLRWPRRSPITGFEGTEHDLSSHELRKQEVRVWGLDDESRGLLRAETTHMPALRAVLARARQVDSAPGLLLVDATVEELDEMYTLVDHLLDATRSRRRRELLGGLRADLCMAMDGFQAAL
ncbi:uncharacterized protein SOCEGT47_063750 [Sorangium cellulosum]|uniref:Uncharacterized protein n=1 Tax=Sorangium cellulosum TaxID=56 RepID=A0A4P2Q9R2_SORCE|nr:uncharacterized protein SOCEGT47_063750 [Sorangium cellulosum]